MARGSTAILREINKTEKSEKTALEMGEQDWVSERGWEGYLGMKSLIPVNFVILIILEPKWWRERNGHGQASKCRHKLK